MATDVTTTQPATAPPGPSQDELDTKRLAELSSFVTSWMHSLRTMDGDGWREHQPDVDQAVLQARDDALRKAFCAIARIAERSGT